MAFYIQSMLPPINSLHEIPIEQIDLDAFIEEDYDEKTKSELVKETVNEFKKILNELRKNGKDISKLPLNKIEKELI